jgi:hypothetical protein
VQCLWYRSRLDRSVAELGFEWTSSPPPDRLIPSSGLRTRCRVASVRESPVPGSSTESTVASSTGLSVNDRTEACDSMSSIVGFVRLWVSLVMGIGTRTPLLDIPDQQRRFWMCSVGIDREIPSDCAGAGCTTGLCWDCWGTLGDQEGSLTLEETHKTPDTAPVPDSRNGPCHGDGCGYPGGVHRRQRLHGYR